MPSPNGFPYWTARYVQRDTGERASIVLDGPSEAWMRDLIADAYAAPGTPIEVQRRDCGDPECSLCQPVPRP